MTRLLSILLVLFAAERFALAAVEVRPQAQVTGAGVFLDEIASSTNAVVPHLRLAAPPRVGQSLTLQRKDIVAALARLGEVSWTNCFGADQVRIGRRTRLLEEDELKLLLCAQLQAEVIKSRGELELRLARPWPVVAIPDEWVTLKLVELPTSGVAPLFVCRFELATTNEPVGAWQVSLQAKIWKEVWTSPTALRRGSLLVDADLHRERRDLLTLREAPADFAVVDPGLELAEQVAPNTPLLGRSLKVTPTVRRGQGAEAMFIDGLLAISMKVEVLEDGVPGQLIRIRNPQTKRELRGTVQNEQTILINL